MLFGKLRCLSGLAIGGLALALISSSANADVSEVGKKLYMENCVFCHGAGGKGDGIMTKYLKIKPTDLTKIAEKSNGIFPYPKVFRIIDGSNTIRAHGETNMPIWGYNFRKIEGAPKDPSQAEEFVAGRIAALTFYLAIIQK